MSRPPSMRRVTTPDGVDIAYRVDAAAAGSPTFVFAHATGFCGGVWDPVLAAIRDGQPGAGLVIVDQRAHGASASGSHPFDWWDIGRDLLTVLSDASVGSPVIGVGHSAGGAGLLLAELLEPGTMAGIVAIEPIVFPPPFERGDDPALAVRAARRRAWFPAREVARERWSNRRPFDRWHPAAFDGYLEHGLVPGSDPDTGRPGFVLACSPEDEAEWFRAAVEHGAWDRLGEVACPVVVVAGSLSDTHADGVGEAIAARLGDGRLRMIEGADHFLPMEDPGLVADITVELTRMISR